MIQEIDHNDGIDFKYTNYEYDEQGRLISEKCYSDETDELLSWYDDYQYDDNGNVISKTWYTSGNGAEKPNEVYTYEYDENGLLLNYALIQTGNLGTASYDYEYTYK